jgi:hypothetical protein
VTDHLRSEDGRIVYDEDFNDPNEERSGDCEVEYFFFAYLPPLSI